MPIATASSQPVPQRVVVGIYEHRHGMDIRVFAHEHEALSWRTGLAKKWWSDAFDDAPPNDDEIGVEYFTRMLERDEFFSTQACEVEDSVPAGAMPADPDDANSVVPSPIPEVSP